MSLQAIRWHFEQPIMNGYASQGVPVILDNMALVDNDAITEYATLRLDFGQFTETGLNTNLERIRGSITTEFFTKKNIGPGRSQDVMTAVLREMVDIGGCPLCRSEAGVLGRTMDFIGPRFFSLEERPYFYSRISCAFVASYLAPVVEEEEDEETSPLIYTDEVALRWE